MLSPLTTRSPAEAAFREIVAAYGLVNRFMGPHFARFRISSSKWGVLVALHRAAGEGLDWLRPADLVQRLLIRPPSVTTVVGRLSRQGLVRIERPDGQDADRRERRIALTPSGKALVERVLNCHAQRIAAAMSSLEPADQLTLHTLLVRLNTGLRELVADDAAGPHPDRSDPE